MCPEEEEDIVTIVTSERDRLNTSVCGLVLCSPYFSGLRVKYSFKSAAATADAADAAASPTSCYL